MRAVCPCVFTSGPCVRRFKPPVTHPSLSALFSSTWITTHLSMNRLDCQGHSWYPLLCFHVQTLHLLLSFTLPRIIFFSHYFVSTFPSPLLFVIFLTLKFGSEDREAMCRAKGLVLSSIRTWEECCMAGLNLNALPERCQWQLYPRCTVNTGQSQGQVGSK